MIPESKRKLKIGVRDSLGRILVLAGLSLAGAIAMASQPQMSQARDNTTDRANTADGAIATNWVEGSFPVEEFVRYTSPFGYRRSPTGGRSREFHSGLDMAAPMGSYIRSWWKGRVARVVDDSRCGVGLVIQSGNWEHIYCHMQGQVQRSRGELYLIDRSGGILIRQGETIPAGARIGRVGVSGRSTGPHLHWGLKYNGEWYDPAHVLRAMYRAQNRRASLPYRPSSRGDKISPLLP